MPRARARRGTPRTAARARTAPCRRSAPASAAAANSGSTLAHALQSDAVGKNSSSADRERGAATSARIHAAASAATSAAARAQHPPRRSACVVRRAQCSDSPTCQSSVRGPSASQYWSRNARPASAAQRRSSAVAAQRERARRDHRERDGAEVAPPAVRDRHAVARLVRVEPGRERVVAVREQERRALDVAPSAAAR